MANEAQAEFWTEIGGPIWLERERFLNDASRPFGEAAVDAAAAKPGERVVDVGCGTGPSALELARRVAPDGRVVGLDISPLLLGRAAEHAREDGIGNVEFIAGDAQTHDLEAGAFDLVFSRFGVMFFEDPAAAFTNLRRALRDTGRLTFACWQDVFSNLWMSLPTIAASSVLGDFELPPEGAPGPFSFADADHVRSILQSAGYSQIDVADFKATMNSSVDEARDRLGFMIKMGPLGEKFSEADEATQERALEAVFDAASEHRSDGTFRLPAAAWIVTARAS